ncbi:MAG: ABC transporter ATP-binding protein, partial [Microthrixaceae bacterium]
MSPQTPESSIAPVDPVDSAPSVESVPPAIIASTAEQLFQDPTDKSLPMFPTIRRLFKGEYPNLAVMATASFLGGLCEATLLLLIANLALSIGGSDVSGQKSLMFGLDTLSVRTLFLVAIVLTAIRLLLQYVASRSGAKITSRLTQSLRNGTFEDFIGASWEVQSAIPEAAVQDLLQRHLAKTQAAVISVGMLMSSGFMVLALMMSAFIVYPLASAAIVVFGGFLFIGLRPMTIKAKRLGRQQMQQGVIYSVQSREAIDLSLEIRAYGVSGDVADRLDKSTRSEIASLYKAQLMARMVTGIYTSAAVLIILASLVAMDAFLNQPLAAVGAIVVVLIRALNQTSGIQAAYHGLGDLVPYIQRLFDERQFFRDSRPPSGDVNLESIGKIEFSDVTYTYDGEQDALRNVSFTVEPGEAVGIIGPSGSGKSTLIQLLLRLRHPSTGSYVLDGIPVSEIDDQSWFSMIAFVPQDSRIYDDTVANNIRFFRPGVTDDQVMEAARRAHVHEEIMAMPDGYNTVLGSRGGSLSGGQRQRVAIARALVKRPAMLVLDEPTSALDMQSESLVHETLDELKKSVTLFVIAHRLSTLNSCDRIMVMD